MYYWDEKQNVQIYRINNALWKKMKRLAKKLSENPEVNKIIQNLHKKKIGVNEIPEMYAQNEHIIATELELNLRKRGRRGFDVISGLFFVEEEIVHRYYSSEHIVEKKMTFENFRSYYEYLCGDIYENACYKYFQCPESIIKDKEIDVKKLYNNAAYTTDIIDNYKFDSRDEEYRQGEKIKKQCLKWFEKFNRCDTYSKFANTVKKYNKSDIERYIGIEVFFYEYIFADLNDRNRFDVIMQYMATNEFPTCWVLNTLCAIYDASKVMETYDSYVDAMCTASKTTKDKRRRNLKRYVELLADGKIEFVTSAEYDEYTHFFIEKIKGQNIDNGTDKTTVSRYFKSFDEFIKHRNGDLTQCDLSHAVGIDVSKYKTDDTTKMPLSINENLEYSVQKGYSGTKFYVKQFWTSSNGVVVKDYEHKFNYWVDFVAFLKGDLSGADLLSCDGLSNLSNWDGIEFTNAKLRSSICKKLGIEYERLFIDIDLVKTFKSVEQNENETSLVLANNRDIAEMCSSNDVSIFRAATGWRSDYRKVDYISDIHLMHRIVNAKCESKDDVGDIVQKIAGIIATEADSLLLIDGDVASEFEVYEMFVKMLYRMIKAKGYSTKIIFTLGNHELWNFEGYSLEQIVTVYRKLLDKYGMYLLHNDLLYYNDVKVNVICYDELCKLSDKDITEKLRGSRYAILGGTGFSGYNKEFNAENGIYRNTLNRDVEKEETKKFEVIYKRLCPILSITNTIIMTHMPLKDWSENCEYVENFVYVSGHTHRNYFYDDGECRVYADNQIGYRNDNPHLKSLLLDNDYDYFTDYADGIYEITAQQYNDFYRGKNITMTFTREVKALYMLKKDGYYCFIYENKSGSLSILNGGAPKKLNEKDIQYYYDNMHLMISTLKSPLDKFTFYQEQIANEIKKIGGDGHIHGCIIDIDYNNHVYVNPIDGTITAYWALDIVHKIVYPTVRALLYKQCPELYSQYLKLIAGDYKNLLAVKENTEVSLLPQEYLDTDIYKASREVKKMQRLSSNILVSWFEDSLPKRIRVEISK